MKVHASFELTYKQRRALEHFLSKQGAKGSTLLSQADADRWATKALQVAVLRIEDRAKHSKRKFSDAVDLTTGKNVDDAPSMNLRRRRQR